MSLNKKISILILIIVLVIGGIFAWDKFINKGFVAFKGPVPFNVQFDGKSFICDKDMCETEVKPGGYNVVIQKGDYEDINQKISVKRREKLIINAELKKKLSFSEGVPMNEKYAKLLDKFLPLEISASDAMRAEYDKLFELVRNIKSPKSVILRKMSAGPSLTAVVFTSDSNRTYFVSPAFDKLVNLGKMVSKSPAIAPTKNAVVFFDNKSYKNQALVMAAISEGGSGYSASVITYFQKPISGDLLTVSDDGKSVFAVDKIDGANVIYKINIEKKSKENVAESIDDIEGINPSFDGRFVLFLSGSGEMGTDSQLFVVDTESRIKSFVNVRDLAMYFARWNSDNNIVAVYPYVTESVVEKPASIRVAEYNPVIGSIRVIQDLEGFEKFPGRMDYVEVKEYRRVILLIENKIYNLDYLAK